MFERTPPDRDKPREEWSVEEIIHHRRTDEIPESDAYREYVADVHVRAGLEPPRHATTPATELSVAEILERKRRHNTQTRSGK